jgi:hypothetical protein
VSRVPLAGKEKIRPDVIRVPTSHKRLTSVADHLAGGDKGSDHHSSNGCEHSQEFHHEKSSIQVEPAN